MARDAVGQEDRKEASGMALASAIRMVLDISRRFHMDLAFIDLPALPLPATYAVYRTTLLYIQLAGDEFQGPEWSANMESLKSTLGHFGKRWNVGSKLQTCYSRTPAKRTRILSRGNRRRDGQRDRTAVTNERS